MDTQHITDVLDSTDNAVIHRLCTAFQHGGQPTLLYMDGWHRDVAHDRIIKLYTERTLKEHDVKWTAVGSTIDTGKGTIHVESVNAAHHVAESHNATLKENDMKWTAVDNIVNTQIRGHRVMSCESAQAIADAHNATLVEKASNEWLEPPKGNFRATKQLQEAVDELRERMDVEATGADQEPYVLDAEWEYDEKSKCVVDSYGPVVLDDWGEPIAALPDVLRALVMVKDHAVNVVTGKNYGSWLEPDEREMVIAALKKAGIE